MTFPTAKKIKSLIPDGIGLDKGTSTTIIKTANCEKLIPTIISNGRCSIQRLDEQISRNHSEILVDGEWFTVGEVGLSREPITTHGIERLGHPIRTAVFQHMANLAGLGGKSVILTHSIPTTLFRNKDIIKSAKQSIDLTCVSDNLTPCNIFKTNKGVSANLILPEAKAAIWDLIFNDNLDTNEIIEDDMTIAVIDIGGFTTDIAVVKIEDGNQSIDDEFSMSFDDLGVTSAEKIFAKLVSDRIKKEAPQITVSTQKMKSAFSTSKLRMQGLTFNLNDEKETALMELSRNIQRKVLKNLPSDCDLYVFTGGGSTLLKSHIEGKITGMEKWYNDFHLPEDGIYSCARGNYKYSLASARKMARTLFEAPKLEAHHLIEAWYG